MALLSDWIELLRETIEESIATQEEKDRMLMLLDQIDTIDDRAGG